MAQVELPKIEAARSGGSARLLLNALLAVVAYHRVGNHPGRWEPRGAEAQAGSRSISKNREPRPSKRRIARNGCKASAIGRIRPKLPNSR